MGEFKAQILGIVLVLSVFGILVASVPNVFTGVWTGIEQKIADDTGYTITDGDTTITPKS